MYAAQPLGLGRPDAWATPLPSATHRWQLSVGKRTLGHTVSVPGRAGLGHQGVAAPWISRRPSVLGSKPAASADSLGSSHDDTPAPSSIGVASSSSMQQPRPWLPKLVRQGLRMLGALTMVMTAGLIAAAQPASAAPAAAVEAAATVGNSRSGKSANILLHSSASTSQKPAPLSGTGVPLGYDDIMRSMVYDPSDVPVRHTKRQIGEQLEALYSQYDNEDFDLGIKQFMIDQAIQQELEDGLDKKGGNEGFEEKISQALFAEEEDEANKEAIKTEDIVSDAFTTEVAEEAMTMFGEPGSLSTAWRVQETLMELSYTQFWQLVAEGRVDKAHFYGREQRSLLAQLGATAPDGARTVKVTVPPDPMLVEHMESHGVNVSFVTTDGHPVHHGFIIQIVRFTFPFMFISAIFYILSWILEPMPNLMRKNEFIRYRRELLYIASKLNYRSPAKEVSIDRNAPDFIAWEDINGIDTVKAEIEEIVDYLKNPALLSMRGVARIGGVMLAGAPGTGKTLLARAIAAESGVRMFTCSGTDFFDVFSNVGARRIRETFEKLRNAAPALLFIDEFDALGAARGGQAGGDEASSIINELLVQMDGYEDNNGVVILGATNRPGAIDSALVRPGRFDRVIYMPLPDAAGRAEILQVHARDKCVDLDINWYEVARTMAGYTGADCMGVMQRAARLAARQGRDRIMEEDLYAAMEDNSIDSAAVGSLTMPGASDTSPTDETPASTSTSGTSASSSSAPSTSTSGTEAPTSEPSAPPTSSSIPYALRKAIAVYEAGKALLAYITPGYPELARISVCPFDLITGYTLFVDDEEDPSDVLTRAEMEGQLVVNLAGRSAEKLVLGQSEITTLGATDVHSANMIAREMVLSAGFGNRMGLVDFMHVTSTAQETGSMLRTADSATQDAQYFHHVSDLTTEQARVALADVIEILEAGEAKAYYGLAINWKPLEALVQALLEFGVLQGSEVAHILESNGVIHFPDTFTEGFGWDEQDGTLKYPHKPTKEPSVVEAEDQRAMAAAVGPASVLSNVRADKWSKGVANRDPSLWHWNMPYTMKRKVPDWYKKELERYVY